MFGLINANARLYNPYLGRFISPDPLLNSEGGPLDYNPYIYARNNPYKYIDRNGEFPWLIAAFAAFATAGGVANVVSNWSDIHNFGEGLGFFCLGAGVTAATLAGAAVLGTAAACAAPYIAGVLGVAAESAVALGTAYAAAGAVYYVYEGCLNSAVYGTPFEFSWNGLAMTMATWGIPAGVGGYLLAKANGLNGWTGMGKSNVMATRHRPLMTEPDKLAPLPSDDLPIYSHADPADVLKQKPLQNHHFATNKNSKFTPKMEKIANKYGLDLNGEWNIEKLPHQGRHSNGYNNWVYKNMQIMDMMPDMNQARFIKEFEQRVKMPIRNNPDMLYKKYWQ